MNVGLYQAAAALNANTRWQELIAENISCSTIPGYRKQDISFSAVQSGLMAAPATNPYAPSAAILMPQAMTMLNNQPGEHTYTGQKTDLALEGPGFFEVQMPNGSLAYTRTGEFSLDSSGRLITKAGYEVQGENGAIQLNPASQEPLSITDKGEVKQGENMVGKIKIVDFNDQRLLSPVSETSYFLANNPNLQTVPVETPALRQGFLENSNVSTVNEMASLLNAMRAYEANQRVIQVNDDRLSRAISELGNPV
jgi:flagellar basal-body rod protein FlgF